MASPGETAAACCSAHRSSGALCLLAQCSITLSQYSAAAMAHATELPWVWNLHCRRQGAMSSAPQTTLLCRGATECVVPGWQAWVGRHASCCQLHEDLAASEVPNPAAAGRSPPTIQKTAYLTA